ncbi:MAG: Hint domain-containing protein [Rubellimicrobium sp.]|nr:Hint domain-containing protein [Rubellimicrobium sp.]
MDTGPRAINVISWSQTELDGIWAAPVGAIAVGATWSWTGEAVCIDGPGASVRPGMAEGQTGGQTEGLADLRARAAQAVRRLLRAVDAGQGRPARDPRRAEAEMEAPLRERGLTVTDGRRSWLLTLIAAGPGRVPLVMFMGDPPPRHAELWVVNHNVDSTSAEPATDVPGGVICFTPGTTILCADGPRPVESVTEGTLVQTKDDGLQEVIWTGGRRISGARLHAMPHLAPVRLRAGALQPGVPDAGVLVSPDHRVVLRGPRARALFNCDEVLVAARDLVDGRGIRVERGLREVRYVHLMLPRHQIVFANGIETESFHPASAALNLLEDAHLAALLDLLPEVAADPLAYGGYARRVLSRSEAAIVLGEAA